MAMPCMCECMLVGLSHAGHIGEGHECWVQLPLLVEPPARASCHMDDSSSAVKPAARCRATLMLLLLLLLLLVRLAAVVASALLAAAAVAWAAAAWAAMTRGYPLSVDRNDISRSWNADRFLVRYGLGSGDL